MFKHHVLSALERIEKKLDSIFTQGERLMAVSQDIKDLTTKIDAATNEVAARITRLSGTIKNSMTDAELADVKAGL